MPSRQYKLRIFHSRPNRLGNGGKSRERGIALVITLILLALLGAISLALVLLVSSDAMINGYYRNYRGSFYAADSGVNVVVESIEQALQAAGAQSSDPPLPTNGTPPTSVTSAYAPFQAGYYSVGDTGSWKGQFEMVANPGGTAVLGTPIVTQVVHPGDSNSYIPCPSVPASAHPNCDTDYDWKFIYPFTVTVKGQSSSTEAEEITETGYIVYSSTSGSPGSAGLPSFAKWGAFITNFPGVCGSQSNPADPLVQGSMTGPFFTDTQWNFGNYSNPGYTFADSIGQVSAKANWINGSTCTNSASAPSRFTQPNFESGFQEGQNYVTPPADNYNQLQAVLNGAGTSDTAPTQAQMNSALKTLSGTSYPATGTVPSGVYIPYYYNSTTGQNVFGSQDPSTGNTDPAGGFYVNGNASISIAATTSTVGGTSHPTQTYSITQGSTTTTIVVDNTLSTTTVSSGSGHSATSTTIQGVPTQVDANGNPVTNDDPSGTNVNPTMLYVNGQITGLSGTVQNDTGVMVTATSDVSITGDLTYLSSPVNTSSDTLVSNTNAGVLGVFTTGNINLYPNSSGSNGGNLTVDASLAALNGSPTGGTSGFETPGNSIGTWTILGGRSEDQAHPVSISTANTIYDRRFAGNFGPPWFPTAVPGASYTAVSSSESMQVNRSSWQEVSR